MRPHAAKVFKKGHAVVKLAIHKIPRAYDGTPLAAAAPRDLAVLACDCPKSFWRPDVAAHVLARQHELA